MVQAVGFVPEGGFVLHNVQCIDSRNSNFAVNLSLLFLLLILLLGVLHQYYYLYIIIHLSTHYFICMVHFQVIFSGLFRCTYYSLTRYVGIPLGLLWFVCDHCLLLIFFSLFHN